VGVGDDVSGASGKSGAATVAFALGVGAAVETDGSGDIEHPARATVIAPVPINMFRSLEAGMSESFSNFSLVRLYVAYRPPACFRDSCRQLRIPTAESFKQLP
jgi:hypothetical protein